MNNIYKIGKNAGYDGCGLCLAAISDNEAVKIRYLREFALITMATMRLEIG